ncbi:MAG: hypothetical protein RJA70_1669 [Pseudomonadota bacterium]
MNVGHLVVSFLISSVGFVLFSFGRKQERYPQVVAGLVLMVMPYFLPGILWMLVATVGVVGLLGWALAAGQ